MTRNEDAYLWRSMNTVHNDIFLYIINKVTLPVGRPICNSSNTRQRTLPGFQVRGVRPVRGELKLINYPIQSTSTLKNFKLLVV